MTTAINVDEDTTASIDLAIQASNEFLLPPDAAKAVAGEVAKCIAGWRADAVRIGIPATEIERAESAFEHADADLARRWA